MNESNPKKLVYTTVDKNGKVVWLRIGEARVNNDGTLTLKLDALPISGVLQVRDL